MNPSVITYQNKFFGFAIEFPDFWGVACWQRKINASFRKMFQHADDHLPTEAGESLFLFMANRYADDSPLIRSSIEMSVYREPAGHDFMKSLQSDLVAQNDRIIECSDWNVGGIPFQYAEIGLYSRQKQTGTIRFACSQHSRELWLYAKLLGNADTGIGLGPIPEYSGEDMAHTKIVFESLRQLEQLDS